MTTMVPLDRSAIFLLSYSSQIIVKARKFQAKENLSFSKIIHYLIASINSGSATSESPTIDFLNMSSVTAAVAVVENGMNSNVLNYGERFIHAC